MHEKHKQYRICSSVSFTSQLLNGIFMKISVGVQQKLSNELQKGVFQVLTQVLTKI